MRKEFKTKRFLAFVLAIMMLVTAFPLQAMAKDFDHGNIVAEKSNYINNVNDSIPIKPVVLPEGKAAADYIKNPEMPKLYTMRADFKVPRNDEEIVGYQPYIATVGDDEYTYTDIEGNAGKKVLTDAEKSEIKKKIILPDIDGYTAPTPKFNVNYQYIKENALKGLKDGEEHNGDHPYLYKPKQGTIKIKHTFQKLENRDEYDKKDGDTDFFYTYQTGVTGTSVTIKALESEMITGYVPEVNVLTTQVPQNSNNFEIEMRYNRAIFDVKYDSNGGTDLPGMTLIYGQTIPKLNFNIKKLGSNLQGWKVNKDITYTDQAGDKQTLSKDTLLKKEDFEPGGEFQDGIKYAMPAEDLTFTAVWKDKEKADYVIQFWTEKPDYDDKDDTLALRDRYDFIGSRRIDNADTGSTPNLTNLDIHGITFPDLNDGRLEKAQDDKEEFERYYFLNEDLTKKQNASEDNPDVQKSVLSTGETVYNIYYDRRVYTLYFTAPNEEAWDDDSGSYWPTLTRNGQVIGKKGSPYKVEARFNQSLDKIWPKDEEISGLPPASSDPGGDMGPIGWTINVNEPGELIFRDTPPYRLSAEDFIDSQDVLGTGDFEGNGHGDQIPIGENETKARGKYEISLAASSWDQSVVHHIDIIKDDFEGNEQIDYDLSYWKSDTNASYAFILPHLQGFTLKKETRDAEWVLEKPTTPKYRTINDLNNARNKITPFRSDADKIEYIDKFPWGTKSFNGKNRYNFANYTRDKYKLKLNNDPKTVKNDNEYGANNILDVPYEFPLKDLKLDTNRVPTKPKWVPEDWGFLGWALDPAGENLVKDGNETKLHYDQVLYAKWGEPETIWKVKFDPNGGSLRKLTSENIANGSKKLEKDGVIHTYPEEVEGEKNTFNIVHKMSIKEPQDTLNNIIEPTRDGYNFAGWEFVKYEKDEHGNDTKDEDTSYKDFYKVPEMYHFGNEVVGNVHLRAIWNKKDLTTIEAIHHFLDSEYVETSKEVQNLYSRRVGSYTTGLGSRQGDKYLLVPKAEWGALENSNDNYKTYKAETSRENSYNQILRVEPEKIRNEQGDLVDNPNAKNNRFEFFYRPFKERVYDVNYLDDRCKEVVEDFIEKAKDAYKKLNNDTSMNPEQKSDAYKKLLADNKAAFKEIKEKYSIVPNETVKNGKRHYDARNYRIIPGWVLNDKPQQQIFFDLYEETDTFTGINGTGLDEIFFFYKDVRVIEVKNSNDPVPEGYVRVTFKADKGGSFTDSKDNPVKEFYYDVIVGLKSDNLPVPQEFVGGKNADGTEKQKEEGKYYITPDGGKKFTHWDNEKLLNNDTIINKSYDFTAYFDWSGVKVNELVKTEAYKGDGGKWINDFAPTIDELKKQIKWVDKNGKESTLPKDATVTILDDAGNEITQDGIYEKVKELNIDDSTELERTVKFPAKIKFADNSVQEIEIPVKIYKNVYEALTTGAMPKVLKDATSAPDGDLADVTGNYVKVMVNPTNKPGNKDSKIYYVNKNAWVNIPEVDISEDAKKLGLTRWAADKETQNENGEFDFDKRHKFTEDTIITPGFTNDVVEQTDPDKKPDVPDGYVKIIVKSTDKATTEFTKIFWVNPTKEVTVQVDNPVGKTIDKTATEEAKAYTFTGWKSDESPARTWASEIKGQFENDTTIEAQYDDVKNIIPYDPDEPTTRPEGYVRVKFEADDGLTLSNVKYYYVKKDAGIKLGNPTIVKPDLAAKTGYKFDKWDKDDAFEITNADITVKALSTKLDNVIPEKKDDGTPNTKPDGYKEVVFKVKDEDQSKGSLEGVTKFYVNPNEYVTINPPTTNAYTGYEFGSWDNDATIPTVYKDKVTTITASFNPIKDVIPKTNPDGTENKKPDGYKTVTFVIDPATGGQIVDKEVTVYYVNPAKDVTINPPQTIADTGYKFNAWDKNTTVPTNYSVDTTVRGSFSKLEDIIPATDDNPKPDGYVTVTFDEGEHGTKIEGQRIYYVNPKANISLGNEKIVKPTVNPETGWKANGWDKEDTQPITGDLKVTAKYAPIDDVIPENNDDGTPNEKPDGYITVTFVKGDHGKELIGQAVYYVNPNKAVVLKDKAPTAVPNTGYKFADWDTQIAKKIQYSDGDKITALYNEIGDVIPQEKTDGSDKPAGYFTVTFLDGGYGTLIGKTVYYVKPNVEVTVPAPSVKANIGYDFKDWDKSLTQTFTKDETITAEYTSKDDIIPQENIDGSDKPDGYLTVTFKAVNGNLKGTTTYYVKPDVQVDLTNTANAITKEADLGYTAESGTWDKPLKAMFNDGDVITFNFKKLEDVIEDKGQEKPEGYVTVKFIPTLNAVDSKEKVYFVNPKANVTIPVAEPVGKEVTDLSGTKYTFNFKLWTVTRGTVATWEKGATVSGVFIQDTEITAKYNIEYKQLINGPVPKDNVVTGKDDVPNPEDLIKNIPGSGEKDSLPDGTTFKYTEDGEPNVNNPGKTTAKVEVHYPDGRTTVVEVPITVVDNVVPQIGTEKPLVPGNYVKVTVDTTDNATDNTKFKKVFWVKPNVEVTLEGILAPTGKEFTEDGVTRTNRFVKWVSDDDNKEYIYEIKDIFTKETNIVAKYEYDKNLEPEPNNDQWLPKGSDPKAKDFIKNPYDDNDPKNKDNLPPGTSFEFVPGTEPDTNEPGTNKTTQIKVTYPNGEVKIVDVKYNVTEDVVEQVDDEKPIVPDKFVEVVVDTTDLATRETYSFKTYWVNPDRMVKIPTDKPQGIKDDKDNRVWLFDYWQADSNNGNGTRYRDVIEDRFTEDTYIKAYYYKADIPEPGSDYVVTDVNVLPDVDEYLKRITPPDGKKIDYITILEQPDVSKPGTRTKAKIEVVYKDGTRSTVLVQVYVQRPGETNTRIVYRDRIVEKEKIVEKIVKIKDNQRLKEVRFMQGFEGKFRPHDGLTRAEAAQILANALKQDGYNYNPSYPINYKDVKQKWYTEAIVITTQANVFKGYDDGYFRPEEKISRAEWIATLKRFQQLQDADGNRMGLKENHWATREVEAAYEEGWLQIYTNGNAKFDANAPITREEVAAVSNRAFGRLVDKTYILRNDKSVINYKDINPSMWSYADILCASNSFIRDENYYMSHGIEYINSIVSSIDGNIIFNVELKNFEILQDKFQRYLR